MEKAEKGRNGQIDKSGSCAIVIFIVGKKINKILWIFSYIFLDTMCYSCNVGDSRAVLSAEQGNVCTPLSDDHKPDAE